MSEHLHGHGHGHGDSGDTDHFSESAATWDEEPGHVSRAGDVAAAVRAAVPLRPDMRVLEIGGGTGLLARALADDIGTALVTDVAPGMVEVAARVLADEQYAGWAARLHDIEHDPLLDERFDLVIGQLTLHHMGDVAAVIARCAQVLEPGGWFAFADLDHDPEGAFHEGVADFQGHDGFTRDNVRRWLQDAGFTNIGIQPAGAVTKELDDGPRDFPMFLAVGQVTSG